MSTRKPKPKSTPITLNAEQKVAVEVGEGVWACVSGPGSGKTTTLIQRYVRLLQSGVPASDILSLSFTKNSAKNMRDRVEQFVDVQKMDRVCGFITFHSLALSFAVAEREHFPFKLAEFPLATEAQSGRFSFEAAGRFAIDPKGLRSYISLQKRNRVAPLQAIRAAEKSGEGEKQALAYKVYETKLIEAGVLDFDSLIFQMLEMLSTNAGIRSRYQYRYVMVDEAQDLDICQVSLLQLLTQQHGNLCAFGDGAQGIYKFRGGDPELFMNLVEVFPSAKVLYLARNHRSTQKLVGFLKTVGPVRELAERFHTSNEEGVDPEIRSFASSFEEATEIIKSVSSPSSAILCRTNRGLRAFEDAAAVAGVRYKILGKSGFYNQPEIKSVLAFLQCSTAPFDSAVLAAIRAPFEPGKFLRKKEITDTLTAQQKADPAKPSIYTLLNRHRPQEAGQVRAVSGFVNYLHGLARHKHQTPAEAVKAIIQSSRAADYYAETQDVDNSPSENLQELVKAASRFQTLPQFLEQVRKIQGASRSKKGLVLGSIHQSKGMEWDEVFVVAAAEGCLPHSKAESIEEEERIFFVGVSRAAKRLTISYSGQPSRFLLPFLPKSDVEKDPFFDV